MVNCSKDTYLFFTAYYNIRQLTAASDKCFSFRMCHNDYFSSFFYVCLMTSLQLPDNNAFLSEASKIRWEIISSCYFCVACKSKPSWIQTPLHRLGSEYNLIYNHFTLQLCLIFHAL